MARRATSRGFWITSAAIAISCIGVVLWRERVPRPTPRTAPATAFSAERAWPVVEYLADTIGHRVIGSRGADSAAAYLERRLRAIHGLEVTVQDAEGAHMIAGRAFAYSVRNVVARLPGTSADAVLLSSHYDSPPSSVGAADDAVAVAALLEIARALAAGPRLDHTIIFLFNDGEEACLCGSHAFTKHPWFADARAFVNLESAGTDGKAVLFQAGPRNSWLAESYARSAPYPYGTVVGQDLMQNGFIPSDTDFRIYRDAGRLPGLDIAMYRGGYAYHTDRDRPSNISPGSVQQMGANALALARALGNGTLTASSGGPAVYYDVLGWRMFVYPSNVARIWAVVALLFAALTIVATMRRQRIGARRALAGFGAAVVPLVLGTALVALAGVLPYYLFHRSMGWYAHPAAGIIAFAGAALAGTLGVHARIARRWTRQLAGRMGVAPQRWIDVWIGALLVWMIVLALLSARGLGSAYLALWPTICGATGLLIVTITSGRRWRVASLIAALGGSLLLLQAESMLLAMFIPGMGRIPAPVAPDVIVALLVGVPAMMLVLLALPAAHRAGGLGAAALVASGVSLIALAVVILQSPYTRLRPQRLAIVQTESVSRRMIEVRSGDFNAPARGELALPNNAVDPLVGRRGIIRQAGASGVPAPALTVLTERFDSAAATRTLTLRARGGGATDVLTFPAGRVTAWSFPIALSRATRFGLARITYIAPPDSGWVVTLSVRGVAPLGLELTSVRYQSTREEASLIRSLPEWVDAPAQIVRRAVFELPSGLDSARVSARPTGHR